MFASIPLMKFSDFGPEHLKLSIANEPFFNCKMAGIARGDLIREAKKIKKLDVITNEQTAKFRDKVDDAKLKIKRYIFRFIFIIENAEELVKEKVKEIWEMMKKLSGNHQHAIHC
ncbi:unnamed protein product [Caenorhabditis brenneri]